MGDAVEPRGSQSGVSTMSTSFWCSPEALLKAGELDRAQQVVQEALDVITTSRNCLFEAEAHRLSAHASRLGAATRSRRPRGGCCKRSRRPSNKAHLLSNSAPQQTLPVSGAIRTGKTKRTIFSADLQSVYGRSRYPRPEGRQGTAGRSGSDGRSAPVRAKHFQDIDDAGGLCANYLPYPNFCRRFVQIRRRWYECWYNERYFGETKAPAAFRS